MNDIVLLVARLVLAAVFAIAGAAKLADLAGSREAMRAFGVPPKFAPWAGLGLPLAELLVAMLLIPRATAWWGALGAFLLLLAFVGGITYNLARGRKPDCHCFGQLHSAPADQSTLIRNGVLAVIAALVVAVGYNDPGASVIGWATDISTAGVIGLVMGFAGLAILLGVVWLLVHLLGQNGRLLLRVDALETALRGGGLMAPVDVEPEPIAPAIPELGLPIGAQAPDFSLSGVYGETMTLSALRAPGKPIMLIFSDPKCAPCNALMPEIGRWQREHASAITVALIGRGTADVNRGKTI
nr:peroxiredoxin family protein [Chloroflexota bacterium]